MLLNTIRFGKINIDDRSVLSFPNGIYGFTELTKFAIVNCKETMPIYWLQSVEEGDVSLPVIDPFIIKHDYVIDVDDKELKAIKVEQEEDVIVYNVVVMPKDISKITVNLVAPILINTKNNLAKQVILSMEQDSEVKYPAFKPLMDYYKEVAKNAGINKKGGQ